MLSNQSFNKLLLGHGGNKTNRCSSAGMATCWNQHGDRPTSLATSIAMKLHSAMVVLYINAVKRIWGHTRFKVSLKLKGDEISLSEYLRVVTT
jgi:hypothetical protein